MKAYVRIAVLSAGLLLVLGTGSAMGARLVPPGNSAANQYTETVPGPGGGMPSSEAKGGSPANVLGPSNAAKLEALGPDGRAAAELAAATAPAGRDKDSRAGSLSAAPNGSSGLGKVLAQVTGTSGSGGMGLLLPLVIAAALIGSVAFLLSRRPRQSHG